MSYIVVDVEANGPCPGLYSMISIGAVVVDEKLDKKFHGTLLPISFSFKQEALDAIGVTREETMAYDAPAVTMRAFFDWVKDNSVGRPIFISDNLAFDWQFINYYFWKYCNENPFGFSGRRISDIWCGYQNDMHAPWKHMRKTKHTHNPVDDAMGNAEAILQMQKQGLKIKLK